METFDEHQPSSKAPASKSEAGFTLHEMAIGMAMMVITLGGIASFVKVGVESNQVMARQSAIDSKVGRVLDAVTRELGQSGITQLTPAVPAGDESLTFLTALDYAEGVTWSNPSRIEFQYDPSDPNDGVDNNGNGLIDEGYVVLVTNSGMANEDSRILATGVREYLQGETFNAVDDNGNGLVDEQGFCIELVDNTLVVRLSLQEVGPNGQIYTRTVETSVAPRN